MQAKYKGLAAIIQHFRPLHIQTQCVMCPNARCKLNTYAWHTCISISSLTATYIAARPAKPHGWMSLWDRQSAYCTYGPLLLHRLLTTVGWYSWGGPSDRGPVFLLVLTHLPWRIQVLFNYDFKIEFFSLSISSCCPVSFFLKIILLSFPWVAIFESSNGPAVSVPSWNKLQLSPPRLIPSTWW